MRDEDLIRLFQPSDFELMEKSKVEIESITGDKKECLWSPVQRMGLVDPREMMICSIGSNLTELMIEMAKRGCNNHQMREELANNSIVRGLFAKGQKEGANTNLGGLDLMVAPLQYQYGGGKHFILRDALNQQLDYADIADKSPVAFLKSPYPISYIEFGETRSMDFGEIIHNSESGEHMIEGVYIREFTVPKAKEEVSRVTGYALRLDPEKPVRVMDLIFTGSPYGKDNILDDASLQISLFIQDEEQTVGEMIQNHFNYYFNIEELRAQIGLEKSLVEQDIKLTSMSDVEAKFFKWGIKHLTKALLYINSEQVKKEIVDERTELLEKISRVASKKQGKLKKQLKRAYNRIYLGPKEVSQDWANAVKSGSIKSHWRRGHFRDQRYGEKLSKVKNIWIEPVLIGSGDLKPKTYVVR